MFTSTGAIGDLVYLSTGAHALCTSTSDRGTLSLTGEVERLWDALEPLLRFHETGGHEGEGSDERLAAIRRLSPPSNGVSRDE